MTSSTKVKKYKLCRRLGAGVFEKCQTSKFILSQAKKAKVKSNQRRSRVTDYGLSLVEKQKIRFGYGLREKQFRGYVEKSLRSGVKTSTPAHRLFDQLERRLDNLVFRAGYANSRPMARQLVSHGHFLVNGKRTTVPSFQVKQGDVVSIREGSKTRTVFNEISKKLKANKLPNWLQSDDKTLETKVIGSPDSPDQFFNFQAVIEFYSK